MNDHRRAILMMLAFVALWAAVEVLAGGVLSRYSPYQVVWTRYAVHLALMLAVWGWREPLVLLRTRRPVFQLARSLLMLGMPASWIVGMQAGVHIGTLMTLFWLSPLFIMALARILLGEPLHAPLWAAAVAGFVGSLILHQPAPVDRVELLVYPVGMALCFSLYVVMTRSLRNEDVRANLFYTALGVLIALTPAMPAVWTTPLLHDLLAMVGVGVLGFLALFALDRMASAAPVSISAPFAYLQIAFLFLIATLAGMELEHTLRRTVAGLLLIVGAALFLWLRQREPGAAGASASRVQRIPKEL